MRPFKVQVSGLLWRQYTPGIVTGLRTIRVKVAVSGTPNRLRYRVVFMVHTQFINKAVGRITQPGGHACFLRAAGWISMA
jgi:hypothetical protein